MLTKNFKLLSIIIFSMALTACANSQFAHKYLMRGQVVKANANEMVICVGTNEGAQVGQILDVYRHDFEATLEEGADAFSTAIGKVSIIEVVNEHYAKVKVVSGEIKLNDMVQLKTPKVGRYTYGSKY